MSTYSLITSLLLVITSYRLQPVIVPADLPAASDFPSIRIGEQVWMTKNCFKTEKLIVKSQLEKSLCSA